jgi:hypothetical protein
MKTTLLLSDEPERVRLMLEEDASGDVAVPASEAGTGCNCDRWGHPCPGYLERDKAKKPTLRFHQQVNSEVHKWNI